MYLKVVNQIKVGNPLVADEKDNFPVMDFGPLINKAKVEELNEYVKELAYKSAVCLWDEAFDNSLFLEGQNRSAYFSPKAFINVSKSATLYYNEPFGPIDSFVVVDRLDELIIEMNVSNGSLVSSIFTDDISLGTRLARDIRAFKVGVNQIRSRGDKEEVFGGIGQSWKGYFVGGELLIHAVTLGAKDEKPVGNFPTYDSVLFV